jgi:predicted anti-sigma-YlaC factor YlaD
MNCNEVRERLPDLAAGIDAGTPEVEKHIASCAACAAKLQGLQQTMALLDEWRAPEPSPYFDTRLQARLREEMARPAAGWLHWLRRPAWAVSLAAVLVAGAVVVVGTRSYTTSYFTPTEAINTEPPELSVPILPGTAVGDLQALERNNELYADFDVLDELQVQDDVTANP